MLIRYRMSGYYFSPKIIEKLDNQNIRSVYSIDDTRVGLGGEKENFVIDLADFEEPGWKEGLPSLLSEEYSLQNI